MTKTELLNGILGDLECLGELQGEIDEVGEGACLTESICNRLEELSLWLRQGGEPPKVSTIECGDHNGPEAHGYFIGEFVTYE